MNGDDDHLHESNVHLIIASTTTGVHPTKGSQCTCKKVIAQTYKLCTHYVKQRGKTDGTLNFLIHPQQHQQHFHVILLLSLTLLRS